MPRDGKKNVPSCAARWTKAAQKMSEQKKASVPNHKRSEEAAHRRQRQSHQHELKRPVHSLSECQGATWMCRWGSALCLVNINDLILLEEDAAPGTKKFYRRPVPGKIKRSKSASRPSEINPWHRQRRPTRPFRFLTSIWTTLIWRICRPCASITEKARARHSATRCRAHFKALKKKKKKKIKYVTYIPPRRVRRGRWPVSAYLPSFKD